MLAEQEHEEALGSTTVQLPVTLQLRKWLGPVELTLFGVGVIIGTGIFVLTGKACGAASVRVSG